MVERIAALCALLILAGCAPGAFTRAWLQANCERARPCLMTCPDGSVAPQGGPTCVRSPPSR